jgi:mono/diheme cytochrome c family protein
MKLSALALFFALPLLPLATTACGGPDMAPAVPSGPSAASAPLPSPSAPAATAAAAEPATWKETTSKDQKLAYMKAKVLPAMAKVMAPEGSKRPDVTCKTCHGPNYADPKTFLPKLTMKDGKITAFAEKPEVANFMATKVVPAMAAAMGEKPYDPATHQGFGCAGCHTVEMK